MGVNDEPIIVKLDVSRLRYDLQQIVTEQVKENIEETLGEAVRNEVHRVAEAHVKERIAEIAQEAVTEGWQRTDEYGRKTGEVTTVKDMLLRLLTKSDGYDRESFAMKTLREALATALNKTFADEVKDERRKRFMDAQAKISAARLRAKVGGTFDVLVDEPGVGRTMGDAPDIDGVVHFQGGRAGEFARVLIERADQHDLFGRKS